MKRTTQSAPSSDWKLSMPERPGIGYSVVGGLVYSLSWRNQIRTALWLGLTGLLFAAGHPGPRLCIVPGAVALFVFARSLWRGLVDARRAVRFLAADLSANHAVVAGYVENVNERLLSNLRDVMKQGGISRTKPYEYPSDDIRSRGKTLSYGGRRLFSRRSGAAWAEYARQREQLRWQAEQLVQLRTWAARSSRPCAGRLHEWCDTHEARAPEMVAFVRSLISSAEASDQIAEYTEDQRAKERAAWAKREEEFEERARRARRVVPLAPLDLSFLQAWSDEEVNTLSRLLSDARIEANELARAEQDLLSRGEAYHAGIVGERKREVQNVIREYQRLLPR